MSPRLSRCVWCVLTAGVLLALLHVFSLPPSAHVPPGFLDVRAFGARGDGRTPDTAAFQKALAAAAARHAPGVDVTPGTYLLGSFILPAHATLNLEAGAVLQGTDDAAAYPVVPGRWEGLEAPVHQALISAHDATDVTIQGQGTIAGGRHVGRLRNPRGPALVEFTSCQRVRVQGVTMKNHHVWTLHPLYCDDVVISDVRFRTDGQSSDNLDVDSCRRVLIDGGVFSSGDDDISLKSGRGLAGLRANRPTEDVTITNCRFERGIGSIALGSEISGGVRRIAVTNCIFQSGLAAFYVKTNEARGGCVEDLSATHLQVQMPLCEVDTRYNPHPNANDVPGAEGITTLRHFRFSNIAVDSTHRLRLFLSGLNLMAKPHLLVKVEGDPKKPFDGLALADLRGNADRGISIQNAVHVEMTDLHLTCLVSPVTRLVQTQANGFPDPIQWPALPRMTP